jgi:hypothetical protein
MAHVPHGRRQLAYGLHGIDMQACPAPTRNVSHLTNRLNHSCFVIGRHQSHGRSSGQFLQRPTHGLRVDPPAFGNRKPADGPAACLECLDDAHDGGMLESTGDDSAGSVQGQVVRLGSAGGEDGIAGVDVGHLP